MNKWIAEFELEDGDTMPEHMDLEYRGVRIDFHCKPLEQEPTTKNDLGVDCISRDEVCRYVAEFVNHEFSTREEEELIDNIITGIEHMPSVTPQEPKTGHWILAMPGGAEEWAYKCSECNFYKFKKTINLRKFKYCPSCGAKMVEPQESEDEE